MHATPTADDHEVRVQPTARFRTRLEQGNDRALFDDYLAQVIAAQAAERGLNNDISALRLVLARLLVEEDDAVELAHSQRAIGADVARGMTKALTRILHELNGGFRAA